MQGNREICGSDVGAGPRGRRAIRERSRRGKWDPLCAPALEKVTQGVGKVYYNRKGNKGSRNVVGKGCGVVLEQPSGAGRPRRCGSVRLGQM